MMRITLNIFSIYTAKSVIGPFQLLEVPGESFQSRAITDLCLTMFPTFDTQFLLDPLPKYIPSITYKFTEQIFLPLVNSQAEIINFQGFESLVSCTSFVVVLIHVTFCPEGNIFKWRPTP